MLVILGVAALVCAASWLVGAAVFALAAGRGGGFGGWLAPAVGLSVLIVAAVAGSRIGDGAGATVGLATVVAASAVLLAIFRNRVADDSDRERRPARSSVMAVTVALIALVAASLPFLIAGHPGVLGVGLLNDDMASHLQIAEHVRDPFADPPRFAEGGYPIGPHAIVAGLSEGVGLSIVDAFAALTLALAPLLALTLLAAFEHLSPFRRGLGALVSALSYLSVAYLAQGAFKEPLEAIILIAFALYVADLVGLGTSDALVSGERPPLWRAVPAGLLAAASVLNYSLPGLVWIAAIAVAILALRYYAIGPRPQRLSVAWRRLVPYAIGAIGVLVLATISEWGRIADFTRLDAFRPDRVGSELGNLKQPISVLEAFGIWPTGDFRTSAAAAGPPALVFWLGGLLALTATAAGIVAAFRSRRVALVGALAATALVWASAAVISTPYFAAKALAIGAPAAMALALGWVLLPGSRARTAIAIALIAGASVSSFLALRSAPVGPEAHGSELDQVRPHVEGSRVLFLGRDDFVGWHLRRAELDGVVTNHFNVDRVPRRYRNPNGAGDKFDIDAVTPKGLRRYDFVVAANGKPRSQYPQGLAPVVQTDVYTLFSVGEIGPRRTLEEGPHPGALLRCRGRRGALAQMPFAQPSSTTSVIPEPPIELGEADWSPGPQASHTSIASVTADLPAGIYDVGIEYDSRRPLALSGPGYEASLPANLDFRGPTPYMPAGTIAVPSRGGVTIEARVDEPNAFARLLRAPNEAHLRRIAFTSLVPSRPVEARSACGEYVDYYVP